jgi:hypothetical protein
LLRISALALIDAKRMPDLRLYSRLDTDSRLQSAA